LDGWVVIHQLNTNLLYIAKKGRHSTTLTLNTIPKQLTVIHCRLSDFIFIPHPHTSLPTPLTPHINLATCMHFAIPRPPSKPTVRTTIWSCVYCVNPWLTDMHTYWFRSLFKQVMMGKLYSHPQHHISSHPHTLLQSPLTPYPWASPPTLHNLTQSSLTFPQL
jgi:hypothetical protein